MFVETSMRRRGRARASHHHLGAYRAAFLAVLAAQFDGRAFPDGMKVSLYPRPSRKRTSIAVVESSILDLWGRIAAAYVGAAGTGASAALRCHLDDVEDSVTVFTSRRFACLFTVTDQSMHAACCRCSSSTKAS